MAYNKYTWVDGELITAEKLNHMEDGIAEGGSCDCGFECSDARATLFEETVTTVVQEGYNAATFAYSALITADTLIVTFDGVEYTCSRISPTDGVNGYGGIGASGAEFSEFPFAILSTPTGNTLAAETAGEHTIAASTTVYTPENVSDCFKGAVGGVVSDYLAKNFASHIHTETVQGEVSVRPDGVASGVDLACPHKPVGIIGIQPIAKNTMGVDGEVILKEMYMAGSYGNNLHLDYLNTTSEVQTFTVYVTYTYIGAGRDR